MEIYQFNKENGKKITQFDSDFIMNRITQTQTSAHIGVMHLDKNGIIGYHQAVVPQLLLIVEGEGVVKGKEENSLSVKSGEAVYWEKNEGHETKTEDGLTAIVIESEELDLSAMKVLVK